MSGDAVMAGVGQTSQRDWIDARYFLDTFGTDPTACEELIALFLRVSAQQLQALSTARKEADWQRVAREAHGLKGSLGLFGARETIELLQSLEDACEDETLPRIISCLDDLNRRMAHIAAEVSSLSGVRSEA